MKFLKSVIFLFLIASLWRVSSIVKAKRLDTLVADGKIPYGPIPNASKNYYSYSGLESSFDSTLNLKRSEEFSKAEFQEMIVNSVAASSQENLKRHLPQMLSACEDYQMDPFWIVSIIMVESGFDKGALSPKNALGLMQIKPDTAEHLYQLMNKKMSDEQIQRNLYHPKENIEVGVFYLKKLLQNFRMNYRYATIAYNMGPNKLKNKLDEDDIDTVNYSYLLKVQTRYAELSKIFSNVIKTRPRPYESTFVVRDQGRKLEEQLLSLFVDAHPAIGIDFLLVQRI
ncbi:MAG: lytic transglycosylase domain-containing protein [Bacteriovorax sp.]|jgi:soluble lytic murein transglycosylase